jgi:hypothetical protein
MLELPITLRVPNRDELPKGTEYLDKLREKANIEEGYLFTEIRDKNSPFGFYSRINVNNSRLWELFLALSQVLPEEICCIFRCVDEEMEQSEYLLKSKIIQQLSCFKNELTRDCTLEFGLVSRTEERLDEIFVSGSKYLEVWGNGKSLLREILHSMKILEKKHLNFIDEYPKVIESLKKFEPESIESNRVIMELKKRLR